ARNPLDAWGTGNDFAGIFRDCSQALHDDPDTALFVQFADLRNRYYLHEGYLAIHTALAGKTAKPMIVVTNYTQLRHDDITEKFAAIGVPVLDGTAAAMRAVRHMLDYRDFLARGPSAAASPPAGVRAKWHARLGTKQPLDETESLALFADYGIPTI